MRDSDNHTHNYHTTAPSISSALLGMAIGAVITYLFANREGQKIRNQILKEGVRFLDEVSQKVQELEEKTENEITQTVESIPEHIEKIQKKGRRFFFRRHSSHES
ncbi:YtxH domain-containing protein [Candidatus Curtissbacteria bacterium]|nr:YtxH domain-containing protein [Candidatus Curtissbacteria bacterium]